MTSTYLQPLPYDDGSALQNSDQVLVPADIWMQFDAMGGAMFVHVGESAYGRLRPALPEDGLAADSCRLPSWMLKQFDAGVGWVSLNSVPHMESVTHMILRARREADVLRMSDPVEVLSEELSGMTDAPGWAVLTMGQELPLACGVFDVIELRGLSGPVMAGTILNTDVSLEFVPAIDASRPPTPMPVIPSPFDSPTSESDFPFGLPSPAQAFASKKGFVPFSGKGHVLGSKK